MTPYFGQSIPTTLNTWTTVCSVLWCGFLKASRVACLVMLLSVLLCSWTLKTKPATYCTNWKHATPRFSNPKTEELLVWSRLDFQPFCEPAFLSPHHGWITGLAIVFVDQSPPSLLESSRLGCDCSILSLVYPTWRKTVLILVSLVLLLPSVVFSCT